VVTSIAAPNRILTALANGCRRHSQRFYVIGDVASPADFNLPGCEFFSLRRQYDTGFRTARETPTRHYARKNIGYLQAIRDGAGIIVETDDDNEPMEGFWRTRTLRHRVPILSQPGWANVYSYFTDGPVVWPRGLPLSAIKRELTAYESCPVQEVDCPIQQGLADENPDVDAIYRLTASLPIRFRSDRAIALASGTWCPFNSQNTVFFPEAYPLLYLPALCSFRMTDIWRSFVAQRILWENGWMLLFHQPTVIQERNEHDLMKDFRDEVPGYLHNETIAGILSGLSLKTGCNEIGNNLVHCYEALVGADLFPREELNLLGAWLEDLNGLRKSARV
jgi:STELLO glycosyltransferases